MNKFIVLGLAMVLSSTVALATPETDPKADTDGEALMCGPNKTLEEAINKNGLYHLLDMTDVESGKNIVQSLWIGGKNMIITAQVPDKNDTTCIVYRAKDVTFNPHTITDIYQALQKSQKGI